jgi:hypothetical protein
MVKEKEGKEKKRQWGEERKKMTRAGGIRARDARTQREENSEGGRKTRRRQSRRAVSRE